MGTEDEVVCPCCRLKNEHKIIGCDWYRCTKCGCEWDESLKLPVRARKTKR